MPKHISEKQFLEILDVMGISKIVEELNSTKLEKLVDKLTNRKSSKTIQVGLDLFLIRNNKVVSHTTEEVLTSLKNQRRNHEIPQ